MDLGAKIATKPYTPKFESLSSLLGPKEFLKPGETFRQTVPIQIPVPLT